MQTTQCNNYHISERTATKVNFYILPRFLEPCPGVDLRAKIAISWQLWFSGTLSSPMSSGTGTVSLTDSSLVLPSRMWWVVVLVTLAMVLVVILEVIPILVTPFLMMLRAARMWCLVTFHQKPFSKAKKAFLSFFLLGFYKSCKCRHQILGNHCLNNQKTVWIMQKLPKQSSDCLDKLSGNYKDCTAVKFPKNPKTVQIILKLAEKSSD